MCENVSDPFQNGEGSGFHAHKGINTLRDAQVLAFVRQRYHYPDGMGDIDRVVRARYFLTAAFSKVASGGGLLHLNSLFNAVKKSIVVDDHLDPLQLGAQMQALSANNIISETIPYTTLDLQTPDGSAVGVDPAQVKSFVRGLISPKKSTTTTPKTTTPASSTPASGTSGPKRPKSFAEKCIH